MRIFELYLSSHRAPLYHSMTFDKAVDVFSNNTLNGKLAHWFGDKKVPGVSLTRNKFLGSHVKHHFGAVWLTLDTDLILRDGYKIVPLDAERANNHSINQDRKENNPWGHHPIDVNVSDRVIRQNQFSEEYLIGSLTPLSKYLKQIVLMEKPMKYDLQVIKNYANEHNIKLIGLWDKRIKRNIDSSGKIWI